MKEQVGKASGDADLEAEGKLDQAKGKLKEAAQKGKDALADLKR